MSVETTSTGWKALLEGEPFNRLEGPQPGYYRTKAVRGGPWVAARIWRDDTGLRGRIGDDQLLDKDLFGKWLFFEALSPDDFNNLDALRKTDPRFAATHAKVDLMAGEMKP